MTKSIEIKECCIILVRFINGANKMYDVKPWFNKKNKFTRLRDNNKFYDCKIDIGGFGIIWDD